MLLLWSPLHAEDYFSAAGYRIKHYRSPTPEQLAGGTVLHFSDDVVDLQAESDLLPINVLPAHPFGHIQRRIAQGIDEATEVFRQSPIRRGGAPHPDVVGDR